MLEQLKTDIGANEPEIIIELIDSYLQEAPYELSQMRQALSHQDAGLLWKKAHTLKSSSAIFGAARLSALCRDLETMGRNGIVKGANAKLKQAESEFGQIKRLLENERRLCSATAYC